MIYYSDEDWEEPLTPSHLLHGRRILSLPEVESSSVANLKLGNSVVTRRIKHLSVLLSRYWNEWRRYYLLDLRESHNLVWKRKGGTFVI